jgi:hypothetical protein
MRAATIYLHNKLENKNKLFSRSAFASIRINSLRRNLNRRAKILEGIVSLETLIPDK